jgi:hypothetical protein
MWLAVLRNADVDIWIGGGWGIDARSASKPASIVTWT